MSVSKPYKRTVRIFTNNSYSAGGVSQYICDEKFAESPEYYIRAFLLIQKDIFELFDFIEPADKNLDTYSYRIHELLLRTCIEFEANCKAILRENSYSAKNEEDWNILDYKKINISHHLSSYRVKLPIWNGVKNNWTPFADWGNEGKPLSWYQTYNQTKHDRHTNFSDATFEVLLNAFSGLAIIISSQFYDQDFSYNTGSLLLEGNYGRLNDGMESVIGGYLRIKFPTDWEDEEKYDFDWGILKNNTNPFQDYNY